MHIGKTKEEYKCQNLFIDKWEEKEIESCDTKNFKIEDTYEGEEMMEEKEIERYLGDIISKDGRNLKNFKARVNKGIGIVKKILTFWKVYPLENFNHEKQFTGQQHAI